MERKFDALIIGGGPGGLSIGSLLAREGITSAIMEQEPTLGGRYRAVHFHGCRSNAGERIPTAMVDTPEESYVFKFLSYLGIPVEYRVLDWTMGLVSSDNPDRIRYFSMDRSRGVENFFEFFAFASGMDMEEATKQDLLRAFGMMADMSEDECRKAVSVPFARWIDENIKDPMAHIILTSMATLSGAPATETNFGVFASQLGPTTRVGGVLFWYPKKGLMEDMVITPLTKYYKDHGGEVFLNRRAKRILIEDGQVTGVVVHNNETRFLEKYSAPVVICAMPIFQAVSANIIKSEFLTEEWAAAVERCGQMAGEDLAGFYLLREDVITREGSGMVHLYDNDYGIPTYVGDWNVGSLFNAEEPPGKQLIYANIPGGLEATHFGLTTPMERVWEANNRFKNAVEKAFPGFIQAIEHEGLLLQLNWGRYAYALMPTEIDIQSPNIRGLYFSGDSVWSVGSMASDKIYQMAFPLCERITEYVRS